MTSKRDFQTMRRSLIERAIDSRTAGGRILISSVPGLAGRSVEDCMTRHSDCVSSAETVYCTEPLQAFFGLVNVSKRDWLAWYKTEKDVQLDEPYNDRSDEIRRAASWKEASWPVRFPDEPCIPPSALWGALETEPLLSLNEIYAILDNATYESTPCLTIAVSEETLRKHDFSQPAIVTPVTWNDSGTIRTTAGFVGLHNFVNGSGHVETLSRAVDIPAGIENWVASEATGYGFDSVYGMVGGFYHAKLLSAGPLLAAA